MSIGPAELIILAVAGGVVLAWVFTILALVDVIRVPSDSDFRAGNRAIWIIALVLLNGLGALIYYAVGKLRATY